MPNQAVAHFHQAQEFPSCRPRINKRHEWHYYFALLREYKRLYGHCSPPIQGVPPQWEGLRRWVVRVRDLRRLDAARELATPACLQEYQVVQMDKIGFEWKPQDVSMTWDGHFARLREYVRTHGHADVPPTFHHPGCEHTSPSLGRWLQYQKSAWVNEIIRLNGTMPATTYRIGFVRREKLRALGVSVHVGDADNGTDGALGSGYGAAPALI